MGLLKLLRERKEARSGMGGVHVPDRFYRCMDCNNVWTGPCPSPCKKCLSTNVSECSEIVYNNLKNHNS